MSQRALNILFVLAGVAGLVLKGQYSGPAHALVHSYGGNVAASFAVYFLARRATTWSNVSRAVAAGLALVVVQLFEVFDGFGLMTNVYDRVDFVANVAGIAIAVALDTVVNRVSGGRPEPLDLDGRRGIRGVRNR